MTADYNGFCRAENCNTPWHIYMHKREHVDYEPRASGASAVNIVWNGQLQMGSDYTGIVMSSMWVTFLKPSLSNLVFKWLFSRASKLRPVLKAIRS